MVSFWPFRSGDNSAASFEKVLSQLSQKITKASAQNDRLRQQQRRYKVLWTLYSSFAYILVALILLLVTGWDKWGPAEYSAIAGGPFLIWGVRTTLDAYYNYRISSSQSYLNGLTKQRDVSIEKLKESTKYNSTQQLLEKYGGTPRKRQPSPQPPQKSRAKGPQSNQSTPQGGRTGFAPPPTANIPGRQPPPRPITPAGTPGIGTPSMPDRTSPNGLMAPPENSLNEPSEEFAPNAYSAPPLQPTLSQPASQYATEGPKWYDRIMDVILGEDETQAKNRIVLICKNCKLVNGQAPPGTRSLEEIGKWRCSSCQAWNGVESEEKKILKQISGEPVSPVSPDVPDSAVTDPGPVTRGMEDEELEDEEVDEDGEDWAGSTVGEAVDAPMTRSKARQRKKA